MILTRTNLEHRLESIRNRRLGEKSALQQVAAILQKNEQEREAIKERLEQSDSNEWNTLDLDEVDISKLFHISDIEKLCITYRLRFLPSHFFKGEIPEEGISKIHSEEKKHRTELRNLHIVAPSKRLKLENADDPLLFAPLGSDYYYLLFKWGNDLHPLRKLRVWPYKSFENLVFTLLIISLLLTAITPVHLLAKTHGMQEYVLLFLFFFKGIAGVVLFYGFAKGKNFNTAIWRSKYYNG